MLGGGHRALESANVDMGLALSAEEIDYLFENYANAGAIPPTSSW
jgi:phosphoribosylformylglycinamidine synthase